MSAQVENLTQSQYRRYTLRQKELCSQRIGMGTAEGSDSRGNDG